ncbi:hypothetical protein GCM10023238_12900 [Streptomyces heliomycini]
MWDGVLRDLRAPPPTPRGSAARPIKPTSLNSGSTAAFPGGARAVPPYNRVHEELTALSRTLHLQIEAIGIAVKGAHVGFDNLEEEQRRRFWTIQTQIGQIQDARAERTARQGRGHQREPVTMTDKKHEADLERVSQQNFLTDFTRGVEERPAFDPLSRLMRTAVESTPVGQALQGRTNFENHSLNAMVDLVEQTDPEDLESSGKALWSARDAIKDAAKELDGHIERVHWVGESGEAFRTWGRSLVTDTYALSDFAGGGG